MLLLTQIPYLAGGINFMQQDVHDLARRFQRLCEFSAFTDWIRTPAGNALPAPAGSVSGVEEAE